MHETVLLQEAVAALVTHRDGRYVDGTFGRGGHSREILAQLGVEGCLLAVDKDPDAVSAAREWADSDSRFTIHHGSFADIKSIMATAGWGSVDGILLDLGVSSPQLDQAERGFSFLRDGALDMRMDPGVGVSAAQWLATASAREIATVLKELGEERFAKRMANAVVAEREHNPIETTLHLARVISEANPAWEKGKHPATRAFQAIRIFINHELDDLDRFLSDVLDVMAIGARLVVISFHSLEDRAVKRFIKREARGDELPVHLPITDDQMKRRLKPIGKAIRASADEVAHNVRARSAVMRIAEKIA